ncbi:MAG TPA: hypothetical protein PLP48_06115 [Acholeplasmataceae bacterium]|nr:hypothetical protein [Acholeplasmataceae bacterium]
MIQTTNRSRMVTIAIITGIILVFDLFTIITNIYVAPILEGYGLPDILIYLKTTIFLLLFILVMVWLKQREPKLTKTTFKLLMVVGLLMIAAYFLALYLYKYMLILDTADIIKRRILLGNPDLYLDFSGLNYRTLMNVLTIFGGFNSELILFAETMAFLMCVYSVDKMIEMEEKKHVYDSFMFDVALFPIIFIWVILAFLSINILSSRFDLLGSLEIGLAVAGFTAVAAAVIPSFKIYRNRDNECTQSFFISTYRLILIVSIFSMILYLILFGLNVSFISLGRGTYRMVSSLLALIFSVIVFFRVKKILSLENK